MREVTNVLSPIYGVNESELDHRREQEYRTSQEPNLAGLYVRDLRQGVLHFRRERHERQDSVRS